MGQMANLLSKPDARCTQ